MRRPMGGNQSHRGADSDVGRDITWTAVTFDDLIADGDRRSPIGKRLSSLWLCAGPEEMAFGVGVSAPMHRLHRRNRAKAEVCGGRTGRRVRMGSHRSIPLRRTRPGGGDGAHV
jgi:hypothetical protein